MKLPKPVAWRVKDDEASDHYGKLIHVYYDGADIRLDHPNAKKLTALLESLFTEAQLREALAQQAAVMRMALGALKHGKPLFDAYWGGDEFDEAIKSLEEALGSST